MKELISQEHHGKLGPLVRLDLFTDAVFAIVITLLAIEIDLPHGVEEGGLADALLHMFPIFVAHIISFTVLALQWIDHHSMFQSAHKCTRALVGSNMLFCLTLTTIPFLTKLIGHFPDSKTAVALYSLGILTMTFAKEAVWQVISRQSISPGRGTRRPGNVLGMCVGAAALGLALLYPRAAVIVWTVFLVYLIYDRLKPKRQLRSEEAQERRAQPDGPTNGSEPIRSETNKTSPAAGSLR